MKTIAFDVMGNDNGVEAAVNAVLEFSAKKSNYKFILVGNQEEINKYTKETDKIKIIHTANVVDKNAGIRGARKDDSSMAIAINLVKNNEADVVMSSGDSGLYLSIATLNIKRLKNIKRPAFMPIFPTIIKNKRFVFLDAGANLEVSAEMLHQWAQVGSIFAQVVLKIINPKVGVLNIGTEDVKGKDFHDDANQSMAADKNLNYVGFIEARELLNDVVDVAVVDGYAGNMILKSMEGAVVSLLKLIRKEIKDKWIYKLGYLLSKKAFMNVKDTLDYRNVGSAWLIGLNGLAVKCHGGADKMSYLGAFSQIDEALSNDLLKKLREVFNGKD